MTRKETLLTQKYELQNQLRTLRGEEPRDIALLTSGWKFQQAVRDAREYSLKQEIAQLETAIANQKAENEKKAKTEKKAKKSADGIDDAAQIAMADIATLADNTNNRNAFMGIPLGIKASRNSSKDRLPKRVLSHAAENSR